MDALIGYTGFVGSSLLKQRGFEAQYRSTNIEEIRGKIFHTVVCAGVPAQKWIANGDPQGDLQKIKDLAHHLDAIQCQTFILISTVDVFPKPIGVDEDSPVEEQGAQAYGLNRRWLEKWVEKRFKRHLIVRLPGLVGPGLRKNIIFDFLNNNNIHAIDSRNVFQFYPMVSLWYEIQIALEAGLSLIHLTAQPLQVAEVSLQGFGRPFDQNLGGAVVNYDLQTKYGTLFGGTGRYTHSKRESIQAIRNYAQCEKKKT